MTEEIRLSAVVIIRNEELNLPGLIANLSGWVHEIVLVDDGSTDATRRIAAEAGSPVKLIDHPMTKEGGFAGQRNAGIEVASGDWLIHLDCDERITPALRAEIIARTRDPALNALRYRRLNYFMHRPMRHGGWETWNRPQIARAGAHRFTGQVHEACEIDGGPSAIGQLEAVMHHLNDHSFAQRLAKSTQYSQMEAERLLANGKPVSAGSLIWRPLVEFAKKYIAQQGFRDGVPGLVAAIHSATSIFRIRALAWDELNKIPRQDLEDQFTDKT